MKTFEQHQAYRDAKRQEANGIKREITAAKRCGNDGRVHVLRALLRTVETQIRTAESAMRTIRNANALTIQNRSK